MNPALQSAKIFLARVMAWPQDGDVPAFVNIHNTFEPRDTSALKPDKNGVVKYPWSGRATRSVEEAANYIDFALSKGSGRDIYVCMSTQLYGEQKTSAKGYTYYKAHRGQDNAVKLKSLYIDIDLVDGKADKSKGYDSTKELFEALGTFLKATGLPRPTMFVSTGGGFHIHWCLMNPMEVADWMPLAYALAEAAKRHGLKCDTQCTIDAARVLRVPATKNFKYDPLRDVTLMGNMLDFDYSNEKIEKILEPYKVKVPYSVGNSSMSLLPPKTPIQGMSDLASGIDLSSTAPVKLDSLLHECMFIADAVANGGSSYQNPLWNLTTLVSTFTEGQRGDAHLMASGHVGYSREETDALFDRKAEDKLTKNLGWPSCATISASGCTHCATCVHFPAGKSPLNFGQKVAPANQPTATPSNVNTTSGAINSQKTAPVTPQGNSAPQNTQTAVQPLFLVPGTGQQDPDLPTGFLRNADGIILYAHHHDDGTSTWLPVSRYPMVDPWMQRDPWSLNFTTETEFGKTSQISIPCKDIGTGEMKKSFQEQGFMVTGGKRGFDILTDFVMAWITKLQSTRDSIVSSVPFGWLVRSGKVRGFVYGGKLHTPQGEEVASNTDPELQRQFSPEGDRNAWLTAARMITDQQRPGLDLILASAFAAPLVRFSGHAGLLLSAYSIESGIGKSTALKIAQAVWGDPVKAVQSLSDTQNSVLNKLGELRALPIYWDELKSEDDTKRFVDTVFRLTLGKEKSRMTSKVTQRTPGTWQTMMVSASNESLMDSISYRTRSTTAGLYRVFEYTVAPPVPGSPGQIDPTVAQRQLSQLHDNYGQIGLEYASFLGRNHQQVEQDVGDILSAIGQEVSMHPDERFWVALIGCLVLGAAYANQLGYTNINETAMKDFLLATLKDMRGNRAAQPVDMRNVANVVNVLGRFLNEQRARHTLMTNQIYRQRGKPPQGAVTIIGDYSRLDSIHVHIGQDDSVLRIGQSYLQDWLTANNYPRHVFIKAMQDELLAKPTTGRLGAGTAYATASEYLMEIDLKGSPLANFLDGA